MFDAIIASEQEVFDYVIGHLSSQGKQSIRMEEFEFCAYRGANGAKCAVGVLIPDEFYNDGMEGDCVDGLIENFPRECLITGIIKHKNILNSLQNMHDSLSTWQNQDSFSYEAQRIADLYNLTIPEIAYTYQPKTKE